MAEPAEPSLQQCVPLFITSAMSDTPPGSCSAQTEVQKTPMTHEERLALAAKLDRELDEFIEGLERKRYTEGWPEDRWQEEMDKHPFFMNSSPGTGELSPLAEGLAKLKYDPEENTAAELATNYKEDGNFNFKHKNYRLAIIGYTEGIKVKCGDPELEASLYNNRAAAHWHLKNYRSSLADSEKSLSIKPEHPKARIRAAKSAFHIQKYDTCLEHCTKHLAYNPEDKEIIDLTTEAKKKKQIKERDQRKREKAEEKEKKFKEEITDAIRKRGIKIWNHDDDDELDISKLEPTLPGAADSLVRIENDLLYWPILLLYPEYGTTDFIRNCPENVPLINQLEQLFPAPWDEDNKYSPGSINVYFEGKDKNSYKVDPRKNISEILTQKYFELKAGTPAFVIVVRNSAVEKRYLQH